MMPGLFPESHWDGCGPERSAGWDHLLRKPPKLCVSLQDKAAPGFVHACMPPWSVNASCCLLFSTHQQRQVLDAADIRDPFIRNWLDLLSFLLSGLPANGTIAAEVAFMFNE